MRHRSTLIYILVFTVFTSLTPKATAGELPLSAKECLRLFLSDNPQIRAGVQRTRLVWFGLDEMRGMYDINLSAVLRLTQDESQSGFSGSKTRIGGLDMALAKHFISATSLSLALVGTRTYDVLNDSPMKYFNPALYYNPSFSSRLVFMVSQPLLRGGWGAPEAARLKNMALAATQADYGFLRMLNQQGQILINMYWDYSLALRSFSQAEESLGDARRLVKDNQEKLSFGLAEKKDLLQAKSALVMRRAELIRSQGVVEDIARTLAVMMAKSLDTKIRTVVEISEDIVEFDEDRLRSDADRSRADLLAARMKVTEKESAARIAGLERLPQLDLNGSISSSGLGSEMSDNLKEISKLDYPVYMMSLSLALPVRNRGAKAKYGRAAADLDAARLELRGVESGVEKDISEALFRYRRAKENLELMKEADKLTSARFGEEKRDFRNGRTTTYFYLLAMDEKRRAVMGLASARVELEKARVNVFAASGKLMDEYGIDVKTFFNR